MSAVHFFHNVDINFCSYTLHSREIYIKTIFCERKALRKNQWYIFVMFFNSFLQYLLTLCHLVSLVTIRVFELWHSLSFWVSSQYEFFSFVTTWFFFKFSPNFYLVKIQVFEFSHFQFEFGHNLTFRVFTIWLFELSQFEFCQYFCQYLSSIFTNSALLAELV